MCNQLEVAPHQSLIFRYTPRLGSKARKLPNPTLFRMLKNEAFLTNLTTSCVDIFEAKTPV